MKDELEAKHVTRLIPAAEQFHDALAYWQVHPEILVCVWSIYILCDILASSLFLWQLSTRKVT
jgi:hypothetical protein